MASAHSTKRVVVLLCFFVQGLSCSDVEYSSHDYASAVRPRLSLVTAEWTALLAQEAFAIPGDPTSLLRAGTARCEPKDPQPFNPRQNQTDLNYQRKPPYRYRILARVCGELSRRREVVPEEPCGTPSEGA